MSNISLPPNLATEAVSVSGKTAQTQVSSADILTNANQLKQSTFKRPEQTIQDLEELRSYQLAKRREFEQQLNKNRLNFGQWIRYAKWEVQHNHDFQRARSIMERALEVNVQHVPFWVRYVEMELLHRNVNHARNLLDRAVTLLPKTDKLWFMYVQTEEAVGNFRGARAVFERWVTWKPPRVAWVAYAEFERRYDEWENARAVYLRYVSQNPGDSTMWMDWIVFETTQAPPGPVQTARIRGIFEKAVDTLLQPEFGRDTAIADIVVRWTQWEAAQEEYERARAIFTLLLDRELLSKQQKVPVFQAFSEFEKRHGEGTAGATLQLKRRLQYRLEVEANPRDYDAWWELAKTEQNPVDILQQAVLVPPETHTKLVAWRRYVFLWIKLALSLEFERGDADSARRTWKKALDVIPHQHFTVGKVWIQYAQFELRHSGLGAARKVLGRAIGQSSQKPKRNIFRYYIQLETQLAEWDRVRKLYEKWLETALLCDYNSHTQMALAVLQEYVQFEQTMGETERCVALFAMALKMSDKASTAPEMSPEISIGFTPVDLLVTMYVDFLKEEFMYSEARDVLRSRVETHETVDLWIALALFESSILSPQQLDELELIEGDTQFSIDAHHHKETRRVFNEAYNKYKGAGDGENALRLLEAWRSYEEAHGTAQSLADVDKKKPTPVRKRRDVDGVDEVYTDYVFPEIKPNISAFLANAQKWAKQG